jgi:hypothetical protein
MQTLAGVLIQVYWVPAPGLVPNLQIVQSR